VNYGEDGELVSDAIIEVQGRLFEFEVSGE
jgi:hypothetical protein